MVTIALAITIVMVINDHHQWSSLNMILIIIWMTENFPGMPSSVAPATADVIALQSQVLMAMMTMMTMVMRMVLVVMTMNKLVISTIDEKIEKI